MDANTKIRKAMKQAIFDYLLSELYPIPSCNDCQYSDPECKRIPCNQCDRYSHFRMHKGCIADLMALARGIVKIVKQHNKK